MNNVSNFNLTCLDLRNIVVYATFSYLKFAGRLGNSLVTYFTNES